MNHPMLTSARGFISRLIKPLSLITGAILAGAVIPAGYPQSGPDEDKVLEEVVVTVRRYAESLQDVPVSVNVMSEEYLDSQNIDQVKDIIDKSPGTGFTRFNKLQNVYSMRGLNSQTEGAAGDPSVLTVVDDVVIVKDYMKSAEFFDVDHVEVLRGPQGTSFGRNTTGGMVHIVSRRPTDNLEASLRAGVGDYNHWELDGYVSGPITDGMSGRLAAHYTTHDGYTDDVLRDTDLGAEENLSLRGSLLFQPADNVEVYIKAEYSNDDDDPPVRQPRNCTDPQDPLDGFVDPCSPWETAIYPNAGSNDTTALPANPEGYFLKRETFNITGQIVWNINSDLTLTSVTGYLDGSGDYNMNAHGSPRALVYSITRNDSSQFTQELRLDNHAAGDRLRWLGGFFYLADDHDRQDGRRFFQEDFTPYIPVYPPSRRWSPTFINVVSNNQTESFGLFGEVSYDFTDQLTLSGGLRYSYDEKDFLVSHNGSGFFGAVSSFIAETPENGGPCPFPPNPVCTLGFSNAKATHDWDHVNYRASLSYQVNDDVMVYGTISEAYKTGGFNGEPQTALDAVTPYNEETAMNYEIGMKSEWFDRLRLNISGYYVEYDDMQVSTFRSSTAGFTTQVIANAAQAEVLGVEADFTWQVNDYVRLSGSFSRLDAEIKNTCLPPEAGPTNCTAAGGIAGVNIDGNRPNNVPDWTATMAGEFVYPLSNGSRVALRMDWRGRSDINNDVFNDPLLLRPGTDIIGARAAWTSADEKWEVSVWGKNLTEEADVLNIGPVPPYLNDNPVGFGPPRTFGGTVSYRFF